MKIDIATSFHTIITALVALGSLTGVASAQLTGPTSSASPYMLPTRAGVTTYSLLTVGDDADPGAGTYRMVGIPDGLGAYDNGDGTFTVLMNHELGLNDGIVRDHGAVGSFVSKLTVNKTTFAVTAGDDLIKNVSTWDVTLNAGAGGYLAPTNNAVLNPRIQIGRLCSGDLAPQSAYFNAASGLGTQNLIFQSGEEVGPEGRQFAHVVTGADAGTSFELPRLGKFSWENGVANPGSGNKTIVLGTDDSTPGQVYLYVGDKTNTGNDIERAGLTNGNLFGIAVTGAPTETRTFGIDGTPNNNETVAFTLPSLGNVSNTLGSALQTASNAASVTNFLRPEDIHWNPLNPNEAYFVTTDQFSTVEAGTGTTEGKSRLWKLALNSLANPTGGTISLVLNGDDIGQMYDNMTVTDEGKVLMQEDVGNNAFLGRVLEYDIASGALTVLGTNDPNRFTTGASNFKTLDEETSGIIDITGILGSTNGEKWYLLDMQSHNLIPGELVQDGQLMIMKVEAVPEPSTIALIGFGAIGLWVIRRRQMKK